MIGAENVTSPRVLCVLVTRTAISNRQAITCLEKMSCDVPFWLGDAVSGMAAYFLGHDPTKGGHALPGHELPPQWAGRFAEELHLVTFADALH